MKKIELLYFTVQKIVCQLLKIDMWNTYGILFSVEQMTFFCRAVEIPKKSVEQSRFKQLHFEQLTMTHFNHPPFYNLSVKTNFVLQLFIWPNKKYSNLQNIGKS